jgi:UDP-N-acetylglucosamine 4,6-dehydratase
LDGKQLVTERKIKGSTVTITGGTGSFGNTMARYLLANGVGEVRIFSRDEAKQDAMRHELNDERVRFYIGDVRDPLSIKSATEGSDLLFHAAALKQVPSAEFFPLEAVATNIQGSANVLRASIESGVKSAVFLSTDKAVYPINAMGMSKALMEKTVLSFARNDQSRDTKIAVTRYGNVMASRGSVIPLFIRQIKAGKPITVTEPNMTRFLMNLNESVDLVEHAFSNADNGDLFVRKAPASTVGDLAAAICDLLGSPNHEIQIIGIRHGEKMYESLLSAEENAKAIDEGGYFRVPLDTRSLDYGIYFEEGETVPLEPKSYTSDNTTRLNIEQIKSLLLDLPEVQAAL